MKFSIDDGEVIIEHSIRSNDRNKHGIHLNSPTVLELENAIDRALMSSIKKIYIHGPIPSEIIQGYHEFLIPEERGTIIFVDFKKKVVTNIEELNDVS